MKKILVILLLLTPFIASNDYAQEKLEHLRFMGIPIDGKIKPFKKNLEKKGLRYYTNLNNHYVFKGYFAGEMADVFAVYDNKTQIVYGVGVSITFMSPEIAKEKYDKFVNDFKEKYETDKWDNKLKYYSDNPDTLINHIVNGNLSTFINSYNDSIDNEFGIYLSKIVLDDKDKELAKSSLNAILGLKLITNLGNIGTIKVIWGDKGESKVSIIYRDEQNTSLIEDKRKEDL